MHSSRQPRERCRALLRESLDDKCPDRGPNPVKSLCLPNPYVCAHGSSVRDAHARQGDAPRQWLRLPPGCGGRFDSILRLSRLGNVGGCSWEEVGWACGLRSAWAVTQCTPLSWSESPDSLSSSSDVLDGVQNPIPKRKTPRTVRR